MPIIQRFLKQHKVDEEIYKNPENTILDHVSASKMVGLLRQIEDLSSFAALIFTNLLEEAKSTSGRIASLNGRVGSLEGTSERVASYVKESKPIDMFGNLFTAGRDWHRTNESQTANLFDAEKQPPPMSILRASSLKPPNLAILDGVLGDDKAEFGCLASYSNPAFFMEQWFILEQEKDKKSS